MLNEKNTQEILDKYGLGMLKRYARYPKGLHNLTYKVETSTGEYTLRIYPYKEPEEIAFELAILDLLKDLPVPHVLKNADGELLTRFREKWLIIYDYLPGESLHTFTEEQFREVGAFLGRYHAAVDGNFAWEGDRHKFYDLPPERITELKEFVIAKKLNHLKHLDEIERELLIYALPDSLPRGPIHVDVKPENVLFHEGNLSGVIDFDNAYEGPLLLDLGKTMAWFGTKGNRFSVEDALEVYKGYISKRPLTAEESNHLYVALKFAFLSHVFVDYYMYAIGKTTQEYFEWIVTVLYEAYKNFTLTKEEFERKL